LLPLVQQTFKKNPRISDFECFFKRDDLEGLQKAYEIGFRMENGYGRTFDIHLPDQMVEWVAGKGALPYLNKIPFPCTQRAIQAYLHHDQDIQANKQKIFDLISHSVLERTVFWESQKDIIDYWLFSSGM
jgi:hypothetical protein